MHFFLIFYKHFLVNADELKRLYRRFRKLDKTNKGYVSESEFASIPELEKNPLSRRICQVLVKESNMIDFPSFAKALSSFSNKGDSISRTEFMFKVYDINNDGFVSQEEMMEIFKQLVGKNLSTAQLQQIVEKTIKDLDVDKDGKLNITEFQKVFFLVLKDEKNRYLIHHLASYSKIIT